MAKFNMKLVDATFPVFIYGPIAAQIIANTLNSKESTFNKTVKILGAIAGLVGVIALPVGYRESLFNLIMKLVSSYDKDHVYQHENLTVDIEGLRKAATALTKKE